MKKVARRRSRQRELIFEFIRNSTIHPVAQSIYDALRKKIPSVSMGNVYRNIKILIEDGRVVRRDFGDGNEHYDAITQEHYHFICEKCGEITDMVMPIQTAIVDEAKKRTDNFITGHTVQFSGLCRSCRKRARRAHP